MFVKRALKTMLMSGAFLIPAGYSLAETSSFTRAMHGPNQEKVTRSAHVMRMSRDGRFVLFTNNFNEPLSNSLKLNITDLKTDTTRTIAENIDATGPWGISDNNRYVAYYQKQGGIPTPPPIVTVIDLATDEKFELDTTSAGDFKRPFISNTGTIFYVKRKVINNQTFEQLLSINIHSGAQNTIVSSDTNFRTIKIGNISADGRHILYTGKKFGSTADALFYQTYHLDTLNEATKVISRQNSGVLYNHDSVSASLNVKGNKAVIGYAPIDDNLPLLEVHDLVSGSTSTYTKAALALRDLRGDDAIYGGVSISDNGQYVSFYANITSQHPDFPNAVNTSFDRIFRLNTHTDELLTVSKKVDGSPIDTTVNSGSHISSDGRFIGFAGAAKGLTPATSVSVEEPYVVTFSDFPSNYLYISLPNSDQNWRHLAGMKLVNDHQWQGQLYFDGLGENAFKFDAGGSYTSPNFFPSLDWETNFGDDDGDNIADNNGGNINVAQGAGIYTIDFNDQTLDYSVYKSATNITFTCHNGNTTLGQSVYIVGASESLGEWDVSKALKLSPTNYPSWSASLTVEVSGNVEWKCIKRNEANASVDIEWQNGNNNTVNSTVDNTSTASF